MTIYTKKGDRGKTSLFGGKKISKADCQIESYGTIDELSSFIGLVVSKIKDKEDKLLLTEIQKDLYQIMATLAGGKLNLDLLNNKIKIFERKMNKIELLLPKLTRFILPGGGEIASLFHILRVTCRKVERAVVCLFESKKKPNITENYRLLIFGYFNRLSDLFFMLARKHAKREEIIKKHL